MGYFLLDGKYHMLLNQKGVDSMKYKQIIQNGNDNKNNHHLKFTKTRCCDVYRNIEW